MIACCIRTLTGGAKQIHTYSFYQLIRESILSLRIHHKYVIFIVAGFWLLAGCRLICTHLVIIFFKHILCQIRYTLLILFSPIVSFTHSHSSINFFFFFKKNNNFVLSFILYLLHYFRFCLNDLRFRFYVHIPENRSLVTLMYDEKKTNATDYILIPMSFEESEILTIG